MSFDPPNPATHDATGLRIGVVAARYNEALVSALLESATGTIEAEGASAAAVERVPGSAELPYAASRLAASGGFDAVIVLGVVIAGDTRHHAIIGESTAAALQHLAIDSGVPVINGIIVTENLSQAEARAGHAINRGEEFARAAIEMACFKQKWTTTNQP